MPVSEHGDPIPWMTYDSIAFIDAPGRIKKSMSVFEYGSGSSTLWWAARVRRVVSCEHNPEYYDKIKHVIPENVEYYLIPLVRGGSYCKKVREWPGVFDIIVIDGRDRNNCVDSAIAAIKPDGVIIFDNTDRKRYYDGKKKLMQMGFKLIYFFGHGPINEYKWGTSVYYRKNNCMGIG